MADRVFILVVAGQHSFLGALENSGLRVLDVLNDASTEFVHLHDVVVSRGFHGECLKQILDATIPKSTIDFVLFDPKTHEAPMRRRHAFVEKRPQSALVLLADYEIRGTFMLKGSPDSLLVLQHGLSTFFPFTSARVCRLGTTSDSVSAEVALVNKSKVSLLHLERQSITGDPNK